jgi:hypothetical protein
VVAILVQEYGKVCRVVQQEVVRKAFQWREGVHENLYRILGWRFHG